MQVEDESGNLSRVLHSIKRNCTLNFKEAHGIIRSFSLWQNRFWDHLIRDERDLNNHFDYVHWNPVKHGYVRCPEEWSQSTFLHWMSRGYYALGWGHGGEPTGIVGMSGE
jgi:putative transposase